MLPFSNPPRNETKTRSSKEVAGAPIADGAFLTQGQMIRTTISSAGRTASLGRGGWGAAWEREYADFGG